MLRSRCCWNWYYVDEVEYRLWILKTHWNLWSPVMQILALKAYPKFCLCYIKEQKPFLDAFIISYIAIFTWFLGLHCDFYHILRFLPYQYFAKTSNNDVLSKNSWNLKKIIKKRLNVLEYFYDILKTNLSVELSSDLIPVF